MVSHIYMTSQMHIKAPLKLQPEDGFMKSPNMQWSINYILYNKVCV